MKKVLLPLWMIVSLLGYSASSAVIDTTLSPEVVGLNIAREADRRDEGFKNQKSDMKMVLKDRHGKETTRVIEISSLEVNGDGDKTLVKFDNPRSVKGTKFLTYTHKSGPDDQWLFLPRIKRVKRISSNNKSGPFMGSEFAYEDFSSQEVEKYTYKYLRDESLNGLSCYVVERYPVDENSGYSRQMVWMDKKEFRVLKVDFFDRKNAHLKTLIFGGYNQYLKRFWRPDEMTMKNHVTGKETTLVWSNYRFQTKLTKRDFDLNALKRSR